MILHTATSRYDQTLGLTSTKRQVGKLVSSSDIHNSRNMGGILDVHIELIREAKDVEEAINPVCEEFGRQSNNERNPDR
ncbi:hypothetical protein E4U52_004271 [Claviceps spartinae]|nr:hypothetical protein E4U52_004271 [Claviceps spartinae]